MAYWKCDCGFEAEDEEQKKKHMEDMKDDPKHQMGGGHENHDHD